MSAPRTSPAGRAARTVGRMRRLRQRISGRWARWWRERALAGRLRPEDGFVFQAFRFALDPTDAQESAFVRPSGERRKAHNGALEQMKLNLAA